MMITIMVMMVMLMLMLVRMMTMLLLLLLVLLLLLMTCLWLFCYRCYGCCGGDDGGGGFVGNDDDAAYEDEGAVSPVPWEATAGTRTTRTCCSACWSTPAASTGATTTPSSALPSRCPPLRTAQQGGGGREAPRPHPRPTGLTSRGGVVERMVPPVGKI